MSTLLSVTWHSCLHYAHPWKSTLEWASYGLCSALVEFWEEQHQALCLPEVRNFFIKWYYNELHLHRQMDVANAVCARFVHDACSGMFTFRVLHGIRIVKFEGRWVCCSLSFVQLLTVNWFAKVFSAKFGGVASFGAAKASNPWKFSLQKLYFSPIHQSLLSRKFPNIWQYARTIWK